MCQIHPRFINISFLIDNVVVMNIFESKYSLLSGKTHKDAIRLARGIYSTIKKRNRRRQPYVRSMYFNGDKVFIALFWDHLAQKKQEEQTRRIRLYECSLELIRNNRFSPTTITDRQNGNILLHRFTGKTKEGQLFNVQIKQSKKSGRKDFISCFPINKPK